jgi:hypothetical protein
MSLQSAAIVYCACSASYSTGHYWLFNFVCRRADLNGKGPSDTPASLLLRACDAFASRPCLAVPDERTISLANTPPPVEVETATLANFDTVAPAEWSCEGCTFNNNGGKKLCEMCGGSAPTLPAPTVLGATPAPPAPAPTPSPPLPAHLKPGAAPAALCRSTAWTVLPAAANVPLTPRDGFLWIDYQGITTFPAPPHPPCPLPSPPSRPGSFSLAL